MFLLFSILIMGANECDPDDPSETPSSETDCTDELDEDGDSLTDCDDDDCHDDPACYVEIPEEICGDRIDNDGDGRMDCEDDECSGQPICETIETETVCDDDFDNDGDGATDCSDADCDDHPDCVLCLDVETCDNETDDDCDGFTDCADPECMREEVCTGPCGGGECPERHSDAEIEEAFEICGLVSGCMGWDSLQETCVSGYLLNQSADEYEASASFLLHSGSIEDLARVTLRDPRVRECLSGVAICDDVFACMNNGEVSELCSDSPSCDGNILRACSTPRSFSSGDMRRAAYDCSRLGLECVEIRSLDPDLLPKEREIPIGWACAAGICEPDSLTSRCVENSPVNCMPHPSAFLAEGFLIEGPSCPLGTTCSVVDDWATCVPDGPVCDEGTFLPVCNEEGDLVMCNNGREQVYECRENYSCNEINGVSQCYPLDLECPSHFTNCNETSGIISGCLDYYLGEIDCVELGFTSCVQSELMSNYAFCY